METWERIHKLHSAQIPRWNHHKPKVSVNATFGSRGSGYIRYQSNDGRRRRMTNTLDTHPPLLSMSSHLRNARMLLLQITTCSQIALKHMLSSAICMIIVCLPIHSALGVGSRSHRTFHHCSFHNPYNASTGRPRCHGSHGPRWLLPPFLNSFSNPSLLFFLHQINSAASILIR